MPTESLQTLVWENDLAAYVASANSRLPGLSTQRNTLAARVKSDGQRAAAWWAFLRFEEDAHLGNKTGPSPGVRDRVTLGDLYQWATRLVPRQDNYMNVNYLSIWLGYARQQWLKSSSDDARETLKTLKSQNIGEEHALLYAEWAALEAKDNNKEKALSIVAKGIKANAQPSRVLHDLEEKLKAGCFVYIPFFLLESNCLPNNTTKGTATISSLASSSHTNSSASMSNAATVISVRTASSNASMHSEDATVSLMQGSQTKGTSSGMAIPPSRKLFGGLGPAIRLSQSSAAMMTPVVTKDDDINDKGEQINGKENVVSFHQTNHQSSAAGVAHQEVVIPSAKPKGFGGGDAIVAAHQGGITPPLSNEPPLLPPPPQHQQSQQQLKLRQDPTPRGGGMQQAPPAKPNVLPPPFLPPPPPAPPPPPPPLSASQVPVASKIISSQGGRDEATVVVRGIAYTKLECIGRGGSSKVFKVMAPNRKIFALKRIRLNGRDPEAAAGFLDEITLLNRLRGRSNIIQLIDSEVHQAEGIIMMVLEYGDIDLARLLQKQQETKQADHQQKNGYPCIDENFIRLHWQQMLQAVNTIHQERIVHSDLKPANFLMVEGQLKLIDFGIAKAIQSDTTSIARESQVGTLNYMSPEAILGGANTGTGRPAMKVGRASDIWSLGCILYQMVYGRTPFAHLPFIQKMHAITDDRHHVEFPMFANSALMELMQRCLDRNPKTRISMKELLEHPFLRPETKTMPQLNSEGMVQLSRDQLLRVLYAVNASAPMSEKDLVSLRDSVFREYGG